MSEHVSLSKTPDGSWMLLVDGKDMTWAVRSVVIEADSDPVAKVTLLLPRTQVEFDGPAEVTRIDEAVSNG